MKLTLSYLALALICGVLESVVRHLPFPTVRWDLGFLAVVYLGLNLPRGTLWVVLIGLAQETLGAPFHGPVVVSYLTVYFFLRIVRDRLIFEGPQALASWVFLLTLAQKGIQGGFLALQGYPFLPKASTLITVALLHAGLALLLFPVLDRIRGGRPAVKGFGNA